MTKKAVEETPRQLFTRLAIARVTRVVNGIRAIRKLANPKKYGYTAADVAKIESLIVEELSITRDALRSGKPSTSGPVIKFDA